MFKEEPISLIYFDQKSQNYLINQEAVDIIKKFEAPLGIISIVGMYRTGKSYLINRMMLNRQKGFGVGPTVNPCTKGLWIWGAPIKGKSVDGQDINILVIDTEGIGALDEDSNHDTRVFSLAILLSSFFVYNSVGSIDENAIQSLSLVISLTKHIQISQQDNDSQNYSLYFPQFLWVVRDFTLQLVDQNSDPITSKQYLDNALQIQSGFSDDIEQKNRIRRLIRTFFEDRDCFTLIRPLVDESNLQNLQNLPITLIRNEFNQQVYLNIQKIEMLRKKYIFGMKIKTINGQQLNGIQFSKLLKSYIDAINNGIIPNIENSWQYICKDENQKNQTNIEEKFDNFIFNLKLPIQESQLKQQFKNLKQDLLDEFKKKALGEEISIYQDDLKQYFDKQINEIMFKNKELNKKQFLNNVQQEFKSLEKQLQSNQFDSLNSYFTAIQNFQRQFQYIDYEQYNDFIQVKLQQASIHFLNLKQQEIEQIKKKLQEQQLQINTKDGQIEIFQIQIQQLENQYKQQQKNFQELKSQRQQDEIQINQKLQQEDQLNKKLQQDIDNLNNNIKDINRSNLIKVSEFEKEQALLNQKLTFQEQNFQDYINKQQEISNELTKQKSEIQNQLKQHYLQIEQENQELKNQVKDLQFQNSEQINNNQQMHEQYQQENENFKIQQKQQQKQFQEYQQQLQKNKQEIENQQQKYNSIIEEIQQNYQKEMCEMKENYDRSIQQHKINEEEQKNLNQNQTNQLAILTQKLHLQNVQYDEIQNQINETKRQYESQITALQYQNSDKQQDNSYIIKIKEKYDQDIKQCQDQHDEIKKKLNQQILDISQKNNDLEFKIKIQQSENLKQVQQLNNELQQSEEQKLNITNSLKQLEKNINLNSKEIDQRYKKQIQQLQNEIEDIKEKNVIEVNKIQEKLVIEINELRNLYENERNSLQKRIQDQINKQELDLQTQKEELEFKYNQEIQSLEEEMQGNKQEIQDLQLQILNLEQKSQNELEIKENQIEIHQRTLNDMEYQLKQLEIKFQNQIDQIQNQNDEEKNKLKRALDLRQHEVVRIEKELDYQKQQLDQKNKIILKYEESVNQEDKLQIQEKEKLNQKIIQLEIQNSKYQQQIKEINNQNQQNELLVQQKVQFLNDKIQESQNLLEKNVNSLEKNQKQIIEKMQDQFNEKLIKLQLEKDTIIQKLDQSKKQNKLKIQQLQDKNLELEKEKLIIQDQRYQLEQKQIELENRLQYINFELQQQKQQQNNQDDKKPIQLEIEKLKNLINKLENEKAETQSLYERDRILWEQKFIFLNNQKEQTKKDYDEAIKKFDQTLSHMSTIRRNQETEVQQSLGDNLQQIEKKYQNQIQDLQEQYQNEIDQLEDKIKQLEQELQKQKDKMFLENQINAQILSEKRFQDIKENEKRLINELNKLKNKEEPALQNYYKNIEMEREKFALKMNDEQDNKKSLLNNQKLSGVHKLSNDKFKRSDLIQHQVTKSQYGNILTKSIFKDDLPNASQEINNRYKKI